MEISMKLFFSLIFTAHLLADSLILENTTGHKIAVEWASSARIAQESNEALMQGEEISPSKLYSPRDIKTTISIPKNASYFRVLVFQTKNGVPELLTNWVDVVSGKTYVLKEEHLTPVLLLNGIGC
jgi:hypothetical protein